MDAERVEPRKQPALPEIPISAVLVGLAALGVIGDATA
jgi:hypothetical protein